MSSDFSVEEILNTLSSKDLCFTGKWLSKWRVLPKNSKQACTPVADCARKGRCTECIIYPTQTYLVSKGLAECFPWPLLKKIYVIKPVGMMKCIQKTFKASNQKLENYYCEQNSSKKNPFFVGSISWVNFQTHFPSKSSMNFFQNFPTKIASFHTEKSETTSGRWTRHLTVGSTPCGKKPSSFTGLVK